MFSGKGWICEEQATWSQFFDGVLVQILDKRESINK